MKPEPVPSLFNLSEVPSLPIFSLSPPPSTWGVNFGGGTNSWAMVLACLERGIMPNWCLFADTGSETPETYSSVSDFAAWCAGNNWPFEVVRWIRKDGYFESIHENSLRTGYLPSKAYILAGCTSKWKIQPMQKWRKEHGFVPTGVAIGYDAGEKRRIESAAARYCSSPDVDLITEMPWYPLVAWGMDRKACHEINERHGIKVGKSSCFLCPNMSKPEWDELRETHPDLYAIAEQVEDKAIKAGHADTARLFKGGYRDQREGMACACFLESDNDELPEGSWIKDGAA